MSTTLQSSQSTTTAASRQVANNFRSNLSALTAFQPQLVDRLRLEADATTWIFARDGYLTTRSETAWWSGCSIPMRTARELLKKLELVGTLGCFLNPTHAAQIRAGFEKLLATQAILAIIPDLKNFRILLHCDDFSAQINAARLFFASGPDWSDQLSAIFQKYPGLPLPQQFLRTPLLDDAEMSELTTVAQKIISRETSRRADKMPEILASAEKQTRTGRIIVLAGSQFNLTDLSNIALRQTLIETAGDSKFAALDPDYPLTASPLALAEATADADALVAADTFRADLPNVVPGQTAWITWITSGRIVPYDPQARRDALLLADPAWRQTAIDAAWPTDRIHIAGWPQIVPLFPSPGPPLVSAGLGGGSLAQLTILPHHSFFLGLLTDTRTIDIPQKVKDFSSQLLLWEYIEDELSRNPLALGDDPDRYLDSRMARLNIHDEGFERPLFFERLIQPAYKRGLALFLINHGIKIALFGRGWNNIQELKPYAKGPINRISDLIRAVSDCRALLQPFPEKRGLTAGLPLPFIPTAKLTPNRLLLAIRHALNANPQPDRKISETLTRDGILSTL